MDQFKTIYEKKMKAKKDAECGEDGLASLELSGSTGGGTGSGEAAPSSTNGFAPQGPIVLRHNQLAPKHPSDHTNMGPLSVQPSMWSSRRQRNYGKTHGWTRPHRCPQ